jgi:hypothetical protein
MAELGRHPRGGWGREEDGGLHFDGRDPTYRKDGLEGAG